MYLEGGFWGIIAGIQFKGFLYWSVINGLIGECGEGVELGRLLGDLIDCYECVADSYLFWFNPPAC